MSDKTTLLPSQIAQRESIKKWHRNHPRHGWLPIDTAPKEPRDKYGYGPSILLFDARGDGEDVNRTMGIGCWGVWEHGPTCWCMEAGDGWTRPTHWMPLPEPPL